MNVNVNLWNIARLFAVLVNGIAAGLQIAAGTWIAYVNIAAFAMVVWLLISDVRAERRSSEAP